MAAFVQRLLGECKQSPLWQKVFLVILLAVLVNQFLVVGFLKFSHNQLNDLDQERDQLFRQLQEAKFLLEDKEIIKDNYLAALNFFTRQIYTRRVFGAKLAGLLKKYTTKTYLYEYQKDLERNYLGIKEQQLTLKVRIRTSNLIPFVNALLTLKGVELKELDYGDNILSIKLKVFQNHSFSIKKGAIPNKRTRISHKRNRVPKQLIPLKGFFADGLEKKAFIGNGLYGIGDKYGKYTIIELSPEQKLVRIKYNNQQKTVRLLKK